MRVAGVREGYSRGCSDRIDEPSQAIPRHGCIPAEPAAVSPGGIIVPRIVIGGVILDQPAGGGIGAVGVGSPCGYGGHGRSRPGREKMLLIRHAPACGVPRAKAPRADWLRLDLVVIATHNLAFARRCHRVLRLHRGHVEQVAPESLRRESRFRQKVSRLWTFSGTVRTNGRTGSAAGLQVVVAMLQRNGSRVRSIMNQSP